GWISVSHVRSTEKSGRSNTTPISTMRSWLLSPVVSKSTPANPCCRPIPAPWFIVLRASLNIKHAPDIPGAQSAGCSTEAEGKPPKAYTFRITPDHPNQIDKSGHILSLNPHLGPCCRTSGLISLENSARVVF